MPVLFEELADGKIMLLKLSGKLTKQDYLQFQPEVEKQIRRHGKIRVLVEMRDFHGWDAGGLWEDIKFDARHFNDVERVALVGDRKWEEWMATICKPFTTADIKYFDVAESDAARTWIGAPAQPAHAPSY